MYPSIEIALNEMEIAEKLNPGNWIKHSIFAGKVAKAIAENCGDLNVEKALVCGTLHDIGRRSGLSKMRHIVDGYEYAMSKGWDEIARISLTHSFPTKDIKQDLSPIDITEEQYSFVDNYLNNIEYDDYDKLIILCDSLAIASGPCILEKRFVDVTMRYGVFPFTVERWQRIYEIKDYFENKIGKSIYEVIPNIEKCIYI